MYVFSYSHSYMVITTKCRLLDNRFNAIGDVYYLFVYEFVHNCYRA